MIYVMSEKFFQKNIEKMAKYNEMFILDGTNYAVVNRGEQHPSVTTKYNRSHPVGGFCPEMRLYLMLKKKKKGEDVNPDKYEREVKEFLHAKSFTASINVAYKALIAGAPDMAMNIFVVIPNLVYKFLGEKIIKRMIKVGEKTGKIDFKCVFSQEDLKDNMKRLKKLLTIKEMKVIDKATKKIEKKYELKYVPDDDDD